MGNEIVYCSKCQTRLLNADFERGAAFRIEGIASCDKCSADVIKLLPPDKIQGFLHQIAKAKNQPPPSEPGRATAGTPIVSAVPKTRRAATPKTQLGAGAWIGLAAAAAALILLVVLVTGSSDRAQSLPETSASRKSASPGRETEAVQALKRAREFKATKPEDIEQQAALYDQAARLAWGTPQHAAVAAESGVVRQKLSAVVTSDLAALEKRVKEAADRQEFGVSAKLLQDSRARHGTPEWTGFIDRRQKELSDAALRLCPILQEKAIAAKLRGAEAEVKTIREQVAKLGVPDQLKVFDAALEAAIFPRARYVRIENPYPVLHLAEVQVFSGGENVALKGTASQISTYPDGGDASRAIDGNTDGAWAGNSVSHTDSKDPTSWWEVDLGKSVPIERVVIWNRTDADLANRMKGYSLVLLDEARNAVETKKNSGYPDPRAEHVFGGRR